MILKGIGEKTRRRDLIDNLDFALLHQGYLLFSKLAAGKQSISGHRVQVKEEYRANCVDAIDKIVDHL